MRNNILRLIASGVTAHQVAKETDIARNTAYRIFSGEASIDNITLKNAEILNEYYLKLKNMNKPVLSKVFVANNGDVFIKHENAYQELSPVNVYDLKMEAINRINNNDFEQCVAKSIDVNSTKNIVVNYFTLKDEFIGTADVHVKEKFDPLQNYVFLYRNSQKTAFGRFVENFLESLKKKYSKN